MPERIVIIGAGGFGRESLDVLEAVKRAGRDIELVGVLDDGPSAKDLALLSARGVEYLGTAESWRSLAGGEERYVIAIGAPSVRRSVSAALRADGLHATTLIHPQAVIGSQATIGDGVVIAAGVQVSTNVSIGDQVHLNPGCIIGHDAVLGDCVSVNPGAIVSGNVLIEAGTLVGAGATILQGLRVGPRSVIGAAACVTRSVEPESTMTGVPARPHRSRDEGETHV